ncbi:MAG TPA: hypothetical protein VHE61_10440 [Opitutaceae bacterium]|nr:hypothetical protein [Opitutaceae bacterium]
MQLGFRNHHLEKCANDHRYAQRKLGPERARKYLLRLQQLASAVCLADVRNLPQAGFHELTGDRKGEIACNVDQPYRLILVPAHDPVPTKEDGGLDWDKVTAVTITDIVNYHG